MSHAALDHVVAELDRIDELTDLDRTVAMLTAYRCNARSGETYNGEWLAHATRSTASSIRRSLHRLNAAGVLEVVSRPPRALIIRFPVPSGHPQPAPLSANDVVHNPRPREHIPAPEGADTRAVVRAIPGSLSGSLPPAAPPADLDDVVALARAAARLERARAQAEGVTVRNPERYEASIADRLVEDDLERIRHALTIEQTTHARAEWLVGRRRVLEAIA